MGDQHPLDPFAQFEGIVDALRDAALRLPRVGARSSPTSAIVPARRSRRSRPSFKRLL